MDFKLVFLKRGVKIMSQANAVTAALGFMTAIPLRDISALSLGLLQGELGKMMQFMGHVQGRIVTRNPDTDTDVNHLTINVDRLCKVSQYTLSQLGDLVRVSVARYQQAKLISIQPGNGLLRSNQICQALANGHEYAIAHMVSQFFINGLEPIQAQTHGDHRSAPSIRSQCVTQFLFKRGIVSKPVSRSWVA